MEALIPSTPQHTHPASGLASVYSWLPPATLLFGQRPPWPLAEGRARVTQASSCLFLCVTFSFPLRLLFCHFFSPCPQSPCEIHGWNVRAAVGRPCFGIQPTTKCCVCLQLPQLLIELHWFPKTILAWESPTFPGPKQRWRSFEFTFPASQPLKAHPVLNPGGGGHIGIIQSVFVLSPISPFLSIWED